MSTLLVATIYVQPQDSVTIQGLVIGGDSLAHSDDELAEAVTVPNAADESEETVDTNEAAVDENETTTEEPAAVEEQRRASKKCFSTYRSCKA